MQLAKAVRNLSLAAIVVGLSVITVLTKAAQPAAAADEVLVSPDGASFSSTYPGSLFDSIAHFVPGDTDQETFYVRNGGSEPGHLRITLADVVAADSDFADALTVSASTANQSGSAVTILSANPCWVLLEGVTLGVGETVAVTTTVALGDLHGLAGQGATAEFSLGVVLHSTAVSQAPIQCGVPGAIVPGTPQTPARGTPAQQGEGQLLPGVSPDVSPEAPADSDGAAELPVLNLPELLGIDPNTWRLFEEYFVFVLIAAFVVGTAWFAFVAWRRRKNEAEPETEGAAG